MQAVGQRRFRWRPAETVRVPKAYTGLQKLLDSLLDDVVDRNDYTAEKAKLMSRRKTLEEQKARLAASRADWLEPLQSWIIAARNAGEITVNGSPQEKKVLVQQQVFGSNLVPDRKMPVVLA